MKNWQIRPAQKSDLDALVILEESCFSSDRLSRRSFRRFLSHEQQQLWVAEEAAQLLGYVLVLFHRGTQLARLYSIAVAPQQQGRGLAKALLQQAEHQALNRGALYLRLEVKKDNQSAIGLYQKSGYKVFGHIQDYYEDHSDALRMQKRIRQRDPSSVYTPVPWTAQNTAFTCGPASLMMAMAGLDESYQCSLDEELQIWREATTIFMTSGHGGCHPLGLAIAARRRGFDVQVWINQSQPLFVDGVRSSDKKLIIEQVHQRFLQQAEEMRIPVHYQNIDQVTLMEACHSGAVPVMLISTYRMDRKKAPHWVVVSGYDQQCFYLHDPDPDPYQQDPLDCQYIPIARDTLEPMSSFGATRLRTAVILSRPTTVSPP